MQKLISLFRKKKGKSDRIFKVSEKEAIIIHTDLAAIKGGKNNVDYHWTEGSELDFLKKYYPQHVELYLKRVANFEKQFQKINNEIISRTI